MWNNKKRPSFLSKIKSVLQGFSKQADSSKPSFISFVRRAPRRTIFGAVFTLILLIGGAAAFRLTQAPQDIRQQAASCSDYNNNQSSCVSAGCTFTPTTTCTLENWQQTPGCSNGGCINVDSCSTYVGDQRSNCTYANGCTYSFSCNPMINCTALSVSSCLLDRCAVFSPSGADFSYCGFKTDYRNCSDKKNFPDAVSCNNNYYCRASETCSSSVNCASYGISVGCSNLAVCRLNLGQPLAGVGVCSGTASPPGGTTPPPSGTTPPPGGTTPPPGGTTPPPGGTTPPSIGSTGKYNAMVYRRSDGVRYTSGLTMKSSTGSVGIVGDHFDISNALTGAHWLSLTPNPINSNIDCLYVDWRVFQHSNPDVSVASGKGCVANFDFPGGDWLYGVNFAVNTSIQFDTGEGDLYCKLDIVDATILNDGIVAKNSLITFNCRPDSTRPFVQFQIRKPGNTNWDSPVWSNPPGSFKYSYTFSQIGNYGVRCRTCAYNNDENSCGVWKEAAQPTWTPPPP